MCIRDSVNHDVGARCNASDQAQGAPGNRCGHLAVAARRCGRVGAMAIVITGRGEFRRQQADLSVVGGHEALCANQLLIAGEGRTWQRPQAEFTSPCRAGRCGVSLAAGIGVGQRGVLRPDTAIEHTDDDAFASLVLPGQPVPQRRRADEGRAGIGL